MAEPAAATPNPDEQPEGDPEVVPVTVALGRVAREVTVLRKEQQVKHGERFMFRGIDDVMNALGPAFRRHGVLCITTLLEKSHEYVETSKGARMCTTRVTARFTFYGPGGDAIDGTAPGESFDSGDKSTAKAMSVALRTFLLQAFTLPTDEPDPDQTIEQLGSVAERQQLPPSRPADRTQPPEQDPWKTDLDPDEQKTLSGLMREENAQALRLAWKDAEAAERRYPHLAVRPGADITRDEADLLRVREPMPLKAFVGLLGKHLTEEGCSVREHLRLNKLPMGQMGQSVPDGDGDVTA